MILMDVHFFSNAAVNAYFVMAVGYNILSLAWMDWQGRPLAPTQPVQAIVTMVLLYVVYAAKEVLGSTAWTLLIGIFLLLILRFGIYQHLANYSPNEYAGRAAWAIAIALNVYGVLALFLAALL